MNRLLAAIAFLFISVASAPPAEGETITRGKNLGVDSSSDGRLAIGLAGGIWIVPQSGGEARRVLQDPAGAQRPRWSPDASRVAFSALAEGTLSLWVHDLVRKETFRLSKGSFFDLQPSWHPDGERIIYSSDRRDTGFDLWEVDLPTGLHWRLSNRPGDETEPGWSADGRDLVYIHHENNQWSLVLRPHGQPEEVLVTATERLSGPSWRPDGSLIMFWRGDDAHLSLDMVILSEPRLIREYMNGEDFETAPVSWLDKHRLFYTAGGVIRQRLFNSWSSRTVPFRAKIQADPIAVAEPVRRELPRIGEPQGKLVIHAARLFDGLGGGYRADRDIVIDGGRIESVEAHAERPGTIVIDMGDLAVLPGYVDVQADLPADADETIGPLLLAAGVTTIVADHAEAEHFNTVWSSKDLPGPRVLPAADWPVGAYSGIADSTTPGLDSLLRSRAAQLIGFDRDVSRRFSESPVIDNGVTAVVLGSRPNGMPAGIALHAELRALVAARLQPEQALRAAGVNAAAALGVDPTLGRAATGAAADLVFVDGDPLDDISDALNVVAVVRNGRFFSVAGLIDRAQSAKTVE
jgi:hypothetical protein